MPDDKRYYQYTCIDEATRERFYSFLTFYFLEDLINQGKRSNNIPMQVLNYLTPIEMKNKLLNS